MAPKRSTRGRGRNSSRQYRYQKRAKMVSPSREPTPRQGQIGWNEYRRSQGLPTTKVRRNSKHGVYPFPADRDDWPEPIESNERGGIDEDLYHRIVPPGNTSPRTPTRQFVQRAHTPDAFSRRSPVRSPGLFSAFIGAVRNLWPSGSQDELVGASSEDLVQNEPSFKQPDWTPINGTGSTSAAGRASSGKADTQSTIANRTKAIPKSRIKVNQTPGTRARFATPETPTPSTRSTRAGASSTAKDTTTAQTNNDRQLTIAGRLQPVGWNPTPAQLNGTTKISAIDMNSPTFNPSHLPPYSNIQDYGIKPAILPTHITYDGRRFVCPACGGATKKRDNLESHIKAKHLGLRTHACHVCDKLFGTGYDVLEHIRMVHGRAFLPGKRFDWIKRKEDRDADRGDRKRQRIA